MEVKIQLESDAQRLELFGPADSHLRQLRDRLRVKVSARNGTVLISGEPAAVRTAADLIDRMQRRLIQRGKLNDSDVDELLSQVMHRIDKENSDVIEVYGHKGIIEPFTK
ncbi:MAG: hypothetical protein ACYSOH_00515, partial [Planctomycetota bacterium]